MVHITNYIFPKKLHTPRSQDILYSLPLRWCTLNNAVAKIMQTIPNRQFKHFNCVCYFGAFGFFFRVASLLSFVYFGMYMYMYMWVFERSDAKYPYIETL